MILIKAYHLAVILSLSQNRIQYIISRYREIFCHFFIHRFSILIIGIHMPYREENKKVINASTGSAQATLGRKPLY